MTQNGSLYKKPFSCTTFYLRYDLTFKVSPYQRPYISGVKRKYCPILLKEGDGFISEFAKWETIDSQNTLIH